MLLITIRSSKFQPSNTLKQPEYLTTSFINGGGTNPRLTVEEMEWHLRPQPDDDIIAFIVSPE
jgi:hypothetical protein